LPANDYHFITRWQIPDTTIDEVFAILADPTALTRWWPSVYLDAQILKPGDENGIGREIALFTKGWLPYTLRWDFTVTEVQRPTRLALAARGDFVGRGIWTLVQMGTAAAITYDWRISAEKQILRTLSFLMKPVFSANHRWAMEQGERSLLLELRRRRATTPEELAAISAPPPPTFR
jgi:hypothetical protein